MPKSFGREWKQNSIQFSRLLFPRTPLDTARLIHHNLNHHILEIRCWWLHYGNKSQKPRISDSNFNRNDLIIVTHSPRVESKQSTENAVARCVADDNVENISLESLVCSAIREIISHYTLDVAFTRKRIQKDGTAEEVSDIRHHHCCTLSERRTWRGAKQRSKLFAYLTHEL